MLTDFPENMQELVRFALGRKRTFRIQTTGQANPKKIHGGINNLAT